MTGAQAVGREVDGGHREGDGGDPERGGDDYAEASDEHFGGAESGLYEAAVGLGRSEDNEQPSDAREERDGDRRHDRPVQVDHRHDRQRGAAALDEFDDGGLFRGDAEAQRDERDGEARQQDPHDDVAAVLTEPVAQAAVVRDSPRRDARDVARSERAASCAPAG